ncbi:MULTISPECIES: cupin domain-containing protein [Cryobacterium]|uniref:Cupin domain-containing protein n=1 Tax=Cryobacterium luteum TaxID=1424661 RepID=A0A1H8L1K0_9MICO|nr:MULTISPECIES: cupin domain-containing protein [Cryobacterium]TFB82354.1 cupin domain-containing protein [Cryobacterium luteum]SEN99042.1 Cupin domain-containing protein [Cryobacterium luteum]
MSVPPNQRPTETKPEEFYLPRGEGRRVWLNGDVYTLKVGGEQSRGALTLIEASVPPGGGPPPHTHDVEDEAFYVIDGVLEIMAEDNRYEAGPGDFVFIPRGTVHAFRNNGALPAKQLLIFTPGYYEGFFFEAGSPVIEGRQAPPRDPADDGRINDVGEKYGSVQVQFRPELFEAPTTE